MLIELAATAVNLAGWAAHDTPEVSTLVCVSQAGGVRLPGCAHVTLKQRGGKQGCWFSSWPAGLEEVCMAVCLAAVATPRKVIRFC